MRDAGHIFIPAPFDDIRIADAGRSERDFQWHVSAYLIGFDLKGILIVSASSYDDDGLGGCIIGAFT